MLIYGARPLFRSQVWKEYLPGHFDPIEAELFVAAVAGLVF